MAKRRSDPEDDGRTIANMNVEGMPWYQEPSPDALPEDTPPGQTPYQMTKEEGRAYTWAAIKAGLAVVLIFGLVYFFFILFCTKGWFA